MMFILQLIESCESPITATMIEPVDVQSCCDYIRISPKRASLEPVVLQLGKRTMNEKEPMLIKKLFYHCGAIPAMNGLITVVP
jgi:hypothetical protein